MRERYTVERILRETKNQESKKDKIHCGPNIEGEGYIVERKVREKNDGGWYQSMRRYIRRLRERNRINRREKYTVWIIP
jgi:hypothetical protein